MAEVSSHDVLELLKTTVHDTITSHPEHHPMIPHTLVLKPGLVRFGHLSSAPAVKWTERAEKSFFLCRRLE